MEELAPPRLARAVSSATLAHSDLADDELLDAAGAPPMLAGASSAHASASSAAYGARHGERNGGALGGGEFGEVSEEGAESISVISSRENVGCAIGVLGVGIPIFGDFGEGGAEAFFSSGGGRFSGFYECDFFLDHFGDF